MSTTYTNNLNWNYSIMSKRLNNKGFAAVEALLIVVIMGILGFTGWFVWHSRQTANKLSGSATIATTKTPTSSVKDFASCKAAGGSKMLETYPEQCVTKDGKSFTDTSQTLLRLNNSGLKLTYDASSWRVENNTSQKSQLCGQIDNATLQYQKNINLVMSISLGSCGKGGSTCYDNIPATCEAETKEVAEVAMGNNQIAFITADKLTYKSDSPQYELWLTSDKSCQGVICGITIPSLTSNPGTISVTVQGEGVIPGNPQTLNDFINLPGVQSAISILKTVHY